MLFVDIKVSLDKIQRRFSLPAAQPPLWSDLCKLIKERFDLHEEQFNLGLAYKDEEGELNTVSSDAELTEIWPKVTEDDERDLDALPPLRFSLLDIPSNNRSSSNHRSSSSVTLNQSESQPRGEEDEQEREDVVQDVPDEGDPQSTLHKDIKAFVDIVKSTVADNKAVKDALDKVLAHAHGGKHVQEVVKNGENSEQGANAMVILATEEAGKLDGLTGGIVAAMLTPAFMDHPPRPPPPPHHPHGGPFPFPFPPFPRHHRRGSGSGEGRDDYPLPPPPPGAFPMMGFMMPPPPPPPHGRGHHKGPPPHHHHPFMGGPPFHHGSGHGPFGKHGHHKHGMFPGFGGGPFGSGGHHHFGGPPPPRFMPPHLQGMMGYGGFPFGPGFENAPGSVSGSSHRGFKREHRHGKKGGRRGMDMMSSDDDLSFSEDKPGHEDQAGPSSGSGSESEPEQPRAPRRKAHRPAPHHSHGHGHHAEHESGRRSHPPPPMPSHGGGPHHGPSPPPPSRPHHGDDDKHPHGGPPHAHHPPPPPHPEHPGSHRHPSPSGPSGPHGKHGKPSRRHGR